MESVSTALLIARQLIADHPKLAIGAVTVATAVPVLLWFKNDKKNRELEASRPGRLVVITGCDSGLGLAMSYWAAKVGYKVLAGCYSLDSDGAKFLKNGFSQDVLQVAELDVTKADSLENFRVTCQNVLKSSKNGTKLWAVIPNAAIGCFGEFFWMPEPMSRRVMEVNFWGTVNLVNSFRHLLLHSKSRLIVITSDCADHPLPGLSMYSASKAALQNWATAVRLEVAKFGISVTSFQPGNFPKQSRLFAGQRQACEEMRAAMSAEEAKFYGDYFNAFHKQLITFLEDTSLKDLKKDGGLRSAFMSLLEGNIALIPVESRNPVVLNIIHFLFKHLPVRGADWVKLHLLPPPAWQPKDYKLILN